MTAQMYEPLHAVPPLTDNHVKMAWLLHARRTARTALDAALAVPRKAAGFARRVLHKLHLDRAAFWLRRTITRVTEPLKAASAVLGRAGLLAAATAVITSPTGRAALASTGRMLGRLGGWIARKVYSGADRALRFFGRPGNKIADKLFAGVVSFGGRVATVAGPVVHRVARLSDPTTTQARLLSGLSQSYVIHKPSRASSATTPGCGWRSSLCWSPPSWTAVCGHGAAECCGRRGRGRSSCRSRHRCSSTSSVSRSK